MLNDYSKIVASKSDSDLLEMVTVKKQEYLPEAISAAKQELLNRKLSFDEIDSAKQELFEKEEDRLARANMSLNIVQKFIFFLIPNPFYILIARAQKSEGYSQKYKDVLFWTLYGFAFYGILMIWNLLKNAI